MREYSLQITNHFVICKDDPSKTAGLINASRRILICRTAKPIDGGQTMITNLPMWLKSLSL
jgi:hypothetical protein